MFDIGTMMMPTSFGYIDRMSEINMLIQNNFLMIADLEKRITNLIDLNCKIAEELVKSKPEPVKRPLSLEQRPSEEKIIEKLFSKSEYSYCLLLKNSFKPLLYKDRNFNLFIGLYDKQRNIVLNSKSVSVKIAVYSSSDDLEQIYSNKQNQPIMKGNTVVDLTQGHASFQKLSIREVTSKFDRGLVHLIISVEAPPFDSEDFDYREIRPLIIKDVMVRAKKQT